MTTMSDDEDRTCPLCTEEMDLTDQQLKPCKCGYEICVWCWHSIIGMAEKDNTKGRCPACRTPYNKERIVAMAANCERMVAAAGRKQKSQKAKSKTTAEARKHLRSVRIVQRNVVYINGLPINLSDESLLERKEYFGQYGKILKVSISRLAGSSAQNASIVNTFSVYITYCREEEAIQCIQAVHNFVLEGKPLRACFGTAKYCYAWLRNMTCSNRNCLYLHEMASQEETFNKDEIISAYTRSRVPKIPSTYLQQRCGDVLPPPVDGYSTCVTSNKTIPKSATNNAAGHVGDSNSHAGNSTTVLPAAASWGLRIAPNYCLPLGNISCSQASNKQKGKSPDCSSVHSSAMVARQVSSWHDENVKASSVSDMNSLSRPLGPLKSGVKRDCSTTLSDVPSEFLQVEACVPDAWDDDIPIASNIPEERHVVAQSVELATSSAIRISASSYVHSSATAARQVSAWHDENVEASSVSDMNSLSRPSGPLKSGVKRDCTTTATDVPSEILQVEACVPDAWDDDIPIASNIPEERHVVAQSAEPATSSAVGDLRISDSSSVRSSAMAARQVSAWHDENVEASIVSDMNSLSKPSRPLKSGVKRDCSTTASDVPSEILQVEACVSDAWDDDIPIASNIPEERHVVAQSVEPATSSVVGDLRISRLDTSSRTTSDASSSSVISVNSSSVYSTLAHDDKETGLFVPGSTENMVHMTRARTVEPSRSNAAGDLRGSILDASSMMEDKSLSNLCKSEKVLELAEKNLTGEKVRSFGRYDGGANFDKKTSLDVAGSSIISGILPLDFDHCDDSLSLANGSLKLLGETNKEDGSLLLSTSWKSPITNQSRFSFARQENLLNQLGSIRELPAIQKSLPLLRDSYDSHQNIIGFGSAGGSSAINRVPVASSVGHSDLSWAKISAPPEFSSTRKAPPGFSFQNKCEQTYRPAYSENNLHNSLCHQSQVQHSDNVVGEEIIDLAMLAVGREHISLGISNSSTLGPTFPAQVTLVTDQSLVHQSVSSQISDHMWGRCLPSNDGYSGPLPVPQNCTSPSIFANLSLHQSKSSRILSNHWEGWNDTQNFDVRGMLDTMRNERSGFNNYYKGNDDVKFHTPNADHYNRECGM